MKFPDSSLISMIISNQIPWFLNNTLWHFVIKIRLQTQNVTQNLIISYISMLNLNTLMQTANNISWLQTYLWKRLVKGPNKPLQCTISFLLNFLIKEDIKHKRFQSKLSIKIEKFFMALILLQTHKEHLKN